MGWAERTPQPVVKETVSTTEAKIISGGIDKMPKERREQALKIMQAAFAEYADLFTKEANNDT